MFDFLIEHIHLEFLQKRKFKQKKDKMWDYKSESE